MAKTRKTILSIILCALTVMGLIFGVMPFVKPTTAQTVYAETWSGPVDITGDKTISDVTIKDKTLSASAYTITSGAKEVTFNNVTFENISTSAYCACVFIAKDLSNDVSITFNNCKFINCGNSSGYGGGIYVDNCKKTVDINFNNCVAYGCYAKEGGFIYVYNNNTKLHGNGTTVIKKCDANWGKAIYVDGNYSVIEGFDFIENVTNNNHGVVFLSVASDNSVIQDCNCFSNYGCSFYLNSEPMDQATSVKIDNCTFYDNGDSYYDIREGAYTNITNCTFVCDDSDCELKKHILVYSDYDTAKGGTCVKSANYKLEKSDDGKYHVQNSADWLKFNLAVFGGNTFYGETVELDGNISAYDRIGIWANDNSAKQFKGTFNGNGNKITLCLGDDKDGNAVANNALFSFTVGATVKNLSVDGYIKGKDGVGAVVAHAESTTLINCENHALINGSGNYAGGLVGWAKDSNIYNSVNCGTVNAGNEVGGIIGRINGSGNIFNCYNEIAVTATGSDKGDFIGKNGGTATAVECFTKDGGNVYKELNINICVYNFGEGVDKSEWRHWKNSEGKIEGDKVNYSDYDKVNRTTNEKSVPSDIKIYFGGDMETGWYLVRRETTVSNRINVSGEVHLIVLSGATLNAQKGIEVAENNSLSVYTTIEDSKVGTVNANGADFSAGIGSGAYGNGGNVYIYGGTVNANGGIYGAGIGGGNNGRGGNVYIYGGTVNANGGEYGAGIGGGIHADGGNFYIYGGTVNATGSIKNGYKKAGIDGTLNLCCCDVEMTSDGQTITEYKGERQVSITATFTEHRLFKTHEETLATYNDKGEVASYGHKEYYECECGHLFAKYESGVLSNEITDLDAWAKADGRVGAHEHNYAIVYDWDGDSCTATATCNKDNLHVIVETVTGSIVTDTEICNEKAKGHYKAVFSNPIFSDQETKPNSVEYGEPLTHNFNEDDLAKTCSRCKIKIFKNDENEIIYTPWGEKEEEQGSLPTTSGNYYLAHDIYLSDTWTVPTGTFNLCLNGKTVIMQEDLNVILVPNGVTLNIYDYDESEKDVFGDKIYSGQIFSHHKNKRGITVKGTLNMYNGAVFGARTGVYVLNGTFNMYGGCVTASNFESEETNVYGGGVLVDGGTFTMDGGKIYGNRLRANGQGEDIFSFGAGVCVDNGGSFTMNGGKIFGNESHYGSGIYVKNGAFTMTDGEIHDNGGEGSIYGGGIYIAENCTAELTGGRIYNNTVHNLEAGAGIYSKGALSLGGTVKIENNRHDYDKGGISNLYFDNSGDSNKIIELISPENGMHVGISMKNNTSFTDIIDQGVERYFFADNDNEYVEYNGKICVREMNGFNNIYKINTESGEHGIVYASVQAVAEEFVDGTTIYITVVPEDGYGIKSLTYNGTDIAKAKSFAMIFEDVTVTAEFDKISFKAVFDENSKVLTFYYDAIDYSKAGVKVFDNLPLDASGVVSWKYHEIRKDVKAVVFDESIQDLKGLISTAFMLAGMVNADNITGAEYLDVSNVVNMSCMFENFGSDSTTLNTVPNVSEWDTSKVTMMASMFYSYGYSSTVLNAVPNVSSWNTAKVIDMSSMFSNYGSGSTVLNAVPNVTNWDTSNVTDMKEMFFYYGYNSEVLNAVPNVSNWDTSNVINMSNMFLRYGFYSEVLNAVPNVTNWKIASVNSIKGMFFEYGFSSEELNAVPCVTDWNTASVIDVNNMFNGYGSSSTVLDFSLNLSGWNLSNVGTCSNMFSHAGENASNWYVIIPNKSGEKTNTKTTWYIGNGSLSISPAEGRSFAIQSFKAVFDENSKVLTFYFDRAHHSGANITVFDELTLNATESNQWSYNGIRKEVKAVVFDKSIQDLKGLTSTAYMLYDMENADNITGAEYLDVSNVTDMQGMFFCYGQNSEELNAVPNVSEWDTSKVMNMASMFFCYGYNSTVLNEVPNVTNWNTHSVTNTYSMFASYGYYSEVLNAVPCVAKWDMKFVTDARNMFCAYGYSSESLDFSLDLTEWNLSKVINCGDMFFAAGQNALNWNVIIPTKSSGKTNTSSVWYVGNGSLSISPAAGRSFTFNTNTFKAVFDENSKVLTFYFDMVDYSKAGIKVFDNLPLDAMGSNQWSYNGIRKEVKAVVFDESIKDLKGLTSTAYMFSDMYYADSITGAEYLNVSNVTNMSYTFFNFGYYEEDFNVVPNVSGWDTSSVTDVSGLFASYGYKSTTLDFTLDLSGWNLSKVNSYDLAFDSAGKNAITWSVTIPTLSSGKENAEDKWFVGDGTIYISPAKNRTFTVYYNIENKTGESLKESNHGYIALIGSALEGETVEISAVANEGYRLATLIYNDGKDHIITATKSFVMPNKSVTVKATFREIKKEFYEVYDTTSGANTLTFYYDDIDHSGDNISFFYDLPTSEIEGSWGYGSIRNDIKAVIIDESVKDFKGLKVTAFMFAGMIYAESITGAEYLDVSNVKSMLSMFENFGQNVKTLNVVPNVTTWDTSNVESFRSVFRGYGYSSTKLNKVPNVSNWNMKKAVSILFMFANYGYNSPSLNEVPNVENWDIPPTLCNASYMFSNYGYSSIILEDVPKIEKWNVKGLTNIDHMLENYGYSSLALNFTYDFSEKIFKNATNSEDMLAGAGNSAPTWSVTIYTRAGKKVSTATEWYVGDNSACISAANGRSFILKSFKAVYDQEKTLTFYYDTFDHSKDNESVAVYDSLPDNAQHAGDWGYHSIRKSVKAVIIDESLKEFNKLTSTAYMFDGMFYAQSITGAEYLDVSKVTNMVNMFDYFGGLNETFNAVPDVSQWDVSNVKDMTFIFIHYGEESLVLNKVPNVEKWNVESVESMMCMFSKYGLKSPVLNKVPNVEKWNTASVSNVSSMFNSYGSTSEVLNFTLDLSNFDLSKVKDYDGMFDNAGKNAITWNVTIPASTNGKTNTEDKWFVGDGNVYISPAGNRTFTVLGSEYVAKIGETKYPSLATAIENVGDGETVTLLKNSDEDVLLSRLTSFILDTNGYNFTGTIDSDYGYILKTDTEGLSENQTLYFTISAVACGGENVVYYFGFEDDPFSNGWTSIDNDGDGFGWDSATAYYWNMLMTGNSGYHCVASESFSNYVGALNTDNWLISPALKIPKKGALVSWFECALDKNWPDCYNVYITEQMPKKGDNLSEIGELIYSGTPTGSWRNVSGELDEKYNGKTVYFVFQHLDYDKYVLLIDDFALYNYRQYEKLADAIEDVDDDGVITLLNDVGEEKITISRNVSFYIKNGEFENYATISAGDKYGIKSSTEMIDGFTTYRVYKNVFNVQVKIVGEGTVSTDSFEIQLTGGIVTVSGNVITIDDISITATPSEGYVLSGFMFNGSVATSSFITTVTSDTTLVVTFVNPMEFTYCLDGEIGGAVRSSDIKGTRDSLTWAIVVPKNDLLGNLLDRVSFYALEEGTYNIRLYSAVAGQMPSEDFDYEQQCVVTEAGKWISVVLDSPYDVDMTKDLWIAIENSDNYPAVYANFVYRSPYVSQLLLNGKWVYLTNAAGNSAPWMIRGYFDNDETANIKFKGYSLLLSSDISINFYMDLTEEQALNGEMKFTIGDRVITVNAGHNENGYYFRCPLNTLEIATTVKAEFTYMNATVIKEYSVMDYVNTVVENKEGKYDEKLIALCKGLANYGYYAQIELASLHDGVTIGNDGYKEMCHYGTLDVESAKSGLQDYGFTDDKKNENIIGVGRSLSLDDKVALNLYIQVKDGYILTKDMITVTGGKEFNLALVSENQYRITVLDIEATNLGTNYTITIDGESITTSVLSYANKVVNGTFSEKSQNAMTALYEYYLKAKAYKGI